MFTTNKYVLLENTHGYLPDISSAGLRQLVKDDQKFEPLLPHVEPNIYLEIELWISNNHDEHNTCMLIQHFYYIYFACSFLYISVGGLF